MNFEKEIEFSDQLDYTKKQNIQESQLKNDCEGSMIKFKNKKQNNSDDVEDQIYSTIKLDNKSKNPHIHKLSLKFNHSNNQAAILNLKILIHLKAKLLYKNKMKMIMTKIQLI